MTRSRAGKASRAGVVSVPHSTSLGWRLGPVSTTPYPITAVPGSIPSTFTARRSGLGLGQLGGVDIEVGEDLGDVVQLLEHLDQLEDPLRVDALDLDRVPGHH